MNTEINYTNMELKKITKHMKKVTNKVSNARPVLQNMYFDNNTIVATDSHRLIRINYEHNKTNELFNPKNNEFVDCNYNYPSVERIIPLNENANNIISINSDEIDLIISVLKAYKHLKVTSLTLTLNKEKSQYEMNINFSDFIMYSADILKKLNINFQLENESVTDNTVDKLLLTVDYFLNALEFLKDYDNKPTLVNDYKIYLYDSVKPILITNSKNDFEYVICPRRQY